MKATYILRIPVNLHQELNKVFCGKKEKEQTVMREKFLLRYKLDKINKI